MNSMAGLGTTTTLLSREDCLELLRTTSLGRIAYSDRAMPAIVLVHYSVVNDTVQIRADASPSWSIASRNAVVAFEADQLDPTGADGWSVSCVGLVRPIPGCPEVLVLEPTLIRGWQIGAPDSGPLTQEVVLAS